MNKLITNDDIKIEDMIYEIRGKQVMLDSDLSKLYQCTNGTKDINKAVKRNMERFPNDFYFQLSNAEYDNLKFRFGTSSLNNHGGVRKLPYVFTEQGIAMLASVLHTNVASMISINIMRAFAVMRHFINENKQIFTSIANINNKLIEHDKNFNEIFDKLNKKEINNEYVFFKGQIFDSYELIIDIIKTAENNIIIIDNYIDNSLIKMLSNKRSNVQVLIVTKENNIKLDIEKYNKQYHKIELKINNEFHDRFIIIDNKTLYHLGASIKDLGKKCFSINIIKDSKILQKINEFI